MRDGEIRGLDAGVLDELTSMISTAAAAILAVRAGSLDITIKPDQSPVTAADRAAEEVIVAGLARILPGTCVVSEEAAEVSLPGGLPDTFVLVDPLDGTRELVAGREEFTVNLALVSGGRPRLGLVAAPAQGQIWRGVEGQGAERLQLRPGAPAAEAKRIAIHTRPCPRSGIVAAVSRSHLDRETDAFLARLPVAQRLSCGSAIKFCHLAEGSADVYPRFSPICEWDAAAGHAVLAAAGGMLTRPDGAALRYGRIDAGLRIAAFVAWGDPSAPTRLGL
jgi:3'(2'), 5'-bisphosphate nucleotidase